MCVLIFCILLNCFCCSFHRLMTSFCCSLTSHRRSLSCLCCSPMNCRRSLKSFDCSLSCRKNCFCCNLMSGRMMTNLLSSSDCFVSCLLCSCLNCRLTRCVTVFYSWWMKRPLSRMCFRTTMMVLKRLILLRSPVCGLRLLCCGCCRRSCLLASSLRLYLPCFRTKTCLWKPNFFSQCGLSDRGRYCLYVLRPLCVKACDDGAGRTSRGGDGGDTMDRATPNILRSTKGHTIRRSTMGRRSRRTNDHSNHILRNTKDRRYRRSTMGHKNHNISMGGIPMPPNTDCSTGCSVCSNTMSFRCCTGYRCSRSTIRTDPPRQSLRCLLLPG